MFVTSFYSYKGGVGRTACLLNTAWLMAIQGRKVMMLDLDLEAPGLSSAYLKISGTGFAPCPPSKGFCELVAAASEKGKFPTNWNKDYMLEGLGPGGRMGLMPAGKKGDPEYEHFIQTFSWRNFYSGLKRGDLFMEALLRGFQALGYEYLFIDARTGHTDVASITTVQLPDLVVFVTNLTDQSIDGTVSRIRTVNDYNKKCLSGEGCRARKAGYEKIPIQNLVVASPLPRGDLDTRQKRIERADARLKEVGARIDIEVDYLDLLALGEENQIVFQRMNVKHLEADDFMSGVSRPYQRLADEISRRNPSDPINLVQDGRRLTDFGLWRLAMAHHIEAIERVNEPAQAGLNANPAYIAASLEKIHAHLEALSPDEDKKELEELETSIEHASLDQQVDYARLWLALSWPFILLNQFKDAAETAERAGQLVGQLLHKYGRRDTDLLDLQALSALREGYALTLCSDWEKAKEKTNYARERYEKLAARPLLHSLSLTQLARIELVLGNMHAADRWLNEADTRLTSKDDTNVANPQIKSKHVQADYYYAKGLMHYERGKGAEAAKALKQAEVLYNEVKDDVGELDLFTLRASLGMLDQQEDVESRITRALELRMPAVSKRLELAKLRSKFCSAKEQLIPDDFVKLLEIPAQVEAETKTILFSDDISENVRRYDPSLPDLLRLEYIHYLMSLSELAENQITVVRVWFEEKGKESFKKSGVWYETYHPLLLTRAMFELAYGAVDQIDRIKNEMNEHASEMEGKGYHLRRAQTLLALAFIDPNTWKEPLSKVLQDSSQVIDSPKDWNWHLPLAFVFISQNKNLATARAAVLGDLKGLLQQSVCASAY